jgi:Tol biopolymer transport system component
VSRLGRTAFLAIMLVVLLCVPSAHAAFPGENGKIAYTVLVDEDPSDGYFSGQTDIFTTTPGQPYRRTNITNSDPYETNPSWSADGTKMVVNSSTYAGSGLYTMDENGGNVTFVAHVSGGHYPVFSPDGAQIAFGEAPTGNDNNYEVSVINVDGTGYKNLTQSPGVDLAPSWSPDGTRIAFNSARASTADIYTIKADGSDVRRITNSGLALEPDWSPDGTRIVFMGPGAGEPDIHVINADGTGEVALTADGYDTDPAWSPDGTKIAFLSRRHGFPDDVYVMDADGNNATRVTWSEFHAGAPSWQPLAPDLSICSKVSVAPRVLQPPDHRFVKVRLSAPAVPGADAAAIRITGVIQDEPTGRVQDALPARLPERVLLKAEAQWGGDGRVYQVSFTASDGQGGECNGVVTVDVPRNGAWPPTFNSAPPSYDSFTPSATP